MLNSMRTYSSREMLAIFINRVIIATAV